MTKILWPFAANKCDKYCNCKQVKHFNGDPLCEMDKFDDIVKMMKQHAVALDSELKTFSRVWVLSELNAALALGMQTQYCGKVKHTNAAAVHIPSVKDAEASFPADKELILKRIKADAGFDHFDEVMSSSILTELAALRVFEYFESRDFDNLLREASSRPACVNRCSTAGLACNIIMLAAVHGEATLLQQLIETAGSAIQWNTVTSQGWTALHHAAVCFYPSATTATNTTGASTTTDVSGSQLKIVELLLANGCDANIKNAFDKTPLEEWIINANQHSSPAACALLFQATAGAHDLVRGFFADPARILRTGDKVLAAYKNERIGDMLKWFSATIVADRGDGTYDISYDDGKADTCVDQKFISLYYFKLTFFQALLQFCRTIHSFL
jgi:hypothetical protein